MENKNPLISVLVPIYGTEKYIERCARSIFEQSWKYIEAIFVDDCTPDDSIEILSRIIEEYPHRKDYVKIIHHETNRGLSAARNTAFDNATGDFFMHVDSDDYLEKDAVRKLVEIVTEKSYDIILFDNFVNYPNKEVINHVNYSDKNSFIYDMLMKKRPSSVWNKLYKTSFYKDSGVRSVEGINYGEDYAITSRLMYQTDSIYYYPEPLYHYEQGNVGSYTKNIKASSVISMYKADCVNEEFFSKAKDYSSENKLAIIRIRSLLAMIKRGVGREDYNVLEQHYPQSLLTSDVLSNLSSIDRLFCYFYKRRQVGILQFLKRVYIIIVK